MKQFIVIVSLVFIFLSISACQPNNVKTIDDCRASEALDDYRANTELLVCATEGDAEAMSVLGILYWAASQNEDPEAFGLPNTITEMKRENLLEMGTRFLEGAAQKPAGHMAMNELGVAYRDGDFGMPKDLERALDYFERATMEGDEMARWNLAEMYAIGKGVPIDVNRSISLLGDGAQRGHEESICAMADIETIKAERDTSAEDLSDIFSKYAFTGCTSRDEGVENDMLYRVISRLSDRRQAEAGLAAKERVDLPKTNENVCAIYNTRGNWGAYRSAFIQSHTVRLAQSNLMPKPIPPGTADIRTFRPENADGHGQDKDPETFDFDIAPFISNMSRLREENLIDCFDHQSNTPWHGNLEQFASHLEANSATGRPNDALLVFSPVAISRDGRTALVYETYYCGGLCAAGQFVLLDKEDNVWQVIGIHLVWVS